MYYKKVDRSRLNPFSTLMPLNTNNQASLQNIYLIRHIRRYSLVTRKSLEMLLVWSIERSLSPSVSPFICLVKTKDVSSSSLQSTLRE